MTDAVVVGAGPNGLAAAITLAQRGFEVTVLEGADEIGGGTRTQQLLMPGVHHDVCSAVHPLGVGSPFLAALDLERHGLTWRWPEIDLAHPLDGGRAGIMVRSLDETAAGLGPDGPAWRRVFGPLTARFDVLTEDIFKPPLHLPRHPIDLARFAQRAVLPATMLARQWHQEGTRALWAGVAADGIQPLGRPTTSAVGMILIASGHRGGWPVAEGGSQAITNAMASLLRELGGTIMTGVHVTSINELPPHRVVLLDVAPGAAADLAGDRMPGRVRQSYRMWRYGAGAFKVDLVVDGGIPWSSAACGRAGTVHCGGSLEEIASAERDVHAGRMPARPFVLVAQQYLADPGRSQGDLHPVWAYAHVPHGYTGDAGDAIIDQIQRFAPGVRDRIVAKSVRGPAALEAYNPNFVGGDIATGSTDPLQMLMRPRLALDPYATGVPGIFLCSAATPPGPGVHGMCGYNAACSAARFLAAGAVRGGRRAR